MEAPTGEIALKNTKKTTANAVPKVRKKDRIPLKGILAFD
jgi:hypothetical protein